MASEEQSGLAQPRSRGASQVSTAVAGGIVLAGGRSVRMGTDKARLPVAPGDELEPGYRAAALGATLVDWVGRRLETVARDVIVIGKDCSLADSTRYEVIEDCRGEQAAIVGILTGLRHSRASWNFVVACDMPFVSAPILRRLLREAVSSGRPVAFPTSERGLEPLHGVWHRSVVGLIEDRVRRGNFSLMALVEELDASILGAAECRRHDPSGRFAMNVNTPGDYRVAVGLMTPSCGSAAGGEEQVCTPRDFDAGGADPQNGEAERRVRS